jgi:TPR repeat protein
MYTKRWTEIDLPGQKSDAKKCPMPPRTDVLALQRFLFRHHVSEIAPLGGQKFGRLFHVQDMVERTSIARRDFAITKAPYGNTVAFVRVLEQLSSLAPHPGLLPYLGYQVSFPPQLFSEYLRGFNLAMIFQKVASSEPVPHWDSTRKSFVIFGLACALMHLHSHGITHCYLKPSRVLLTPDFEPKIADYLFGQSEAPFNDEDDMLSVAPEFINQEFTPAFDIFSWGIIVRQIVTGSVWTSGPIDAGLSPFIGGLITHSMSEDPTRRPTASQLVYAMRHCVELLPGVDRDLFDTFSDKYFIATVKTADDQLLFATPSPHGSLVDSGGISAIRSQAESGDVTAMVSLGTSYSQGSNRREAARWFTAAADKGNLSATVRLCRLLLTFEKPDLATVKTYLEKAVGRGYVAAIFELGRLFQKEGNLERARDLLHRAVSCGYKEAFFAYAEVCYSQHIYPEALAFYRRAGFECGNDTALVKYARMLIGGINCPPDFGAGLRALEVAVGHRDADAQFAFGALLAEGAPGLEQDEQEAAAYFKLADDQGSVPACARYAAVLARGEGVIRNQAAAVPYFVRAIEGGDAGAMCEYARMLHGQPDVSGAWVEGFRLYQRAAGCGSREVKAAAYLGMGRCAEEGKGMVVDRGAARTFYQAAVAEGSQEAAERLDRL